jgi:peptide deformylase
VHPLPAPQTCAVSPARTTGMRRTAARRRSVPGLRRMRGRVRRIVTLSGPDRALLRSRSRPVAVIDEAMRKVLVDMLATMRSARGVGLAAVQIGVPVRALVADPGTGPLALINPRLLRRRGTQFGAEGCLSIPGAYGTVRRSREVDVEGRNARGRRIVVRGSGLLARILQHEIDHLNGVLFVDRMPATRRRRGQAPATGALAPTAAQKAARRH